MNILIISAWYPMPDRLGGDHRFFRLLEGLLGAHRLTYLAFSPESQAEKYGSDETRRYREDLAKAGIGLLPPGVRAGLQGARYDAVFFQNYFHALPWLDEVRTFQPHARVVVDNGDVAYRRFFSKAELTGDAADYAKAEQIKREELDAYRRADAIIGVSQDDLDVVKKEIPDVRAFIIPNIHPIPALTKGEKKRNTLIFVGSFLHPPNVDGMVWFVNDVLPIIMATRPDVRLQIVGYGPTPEVLALASPHVEVVGYVPETAPYLESAYISVAPLRYGAGVKGKIGEAMAYRLPVVTTNVGIDGFGLTPGHDVLVGDDAQTFAAHVLRVLEDPMLHENLAEAGFQFIQGRFSAEAVQTRVDEMMAALPSLPIRRLPLSRRWPLLWEEFLDRHVRWRFARNGNR